jgi:hypothetical protein
MFQMDLKQALVSVIVVPSQSQIQRVSKAENRIFAFS